MAYQKQTWNNYNDSLSIEQNKANNAFATAEGLNHIEDGVKKVDEEVESARGTHKNLLQRLADTDKKIDSKANSDSIGEVVNEVSGLKNSISDIITNPATGISEEEIRLARKGKPVLSEKINEIDENISSSKKQIFDFFYRFGNEYTEKTNGWNQAYVSPNTTPIFTKELNHLNIKHESVSGVGDVGIVSGLIDFTDIDTLYIEWEQRGSGPTTNLRSNFSVWNARNAARTQGEINLQKMGVFNRTIDSIDVSTLSGNQYVRIHSGDNLSTGTVTKGEVRVYAIYGEKKLMNVTDKTEIVNNINVMKGFQKQQVYLSKGADVYVEKTPEALYLSFTGSAIFREGHYSYTIPYQSFVDTVGGGQTSPTGKENCLLIPGNYTLVVDVFKTGSEPRIKIIPRAEYDIERHILLIAYVSGLIVDGAFKQIIIDNEIEKIKRSSPSNNRQAEIDNVVFKSAKRATDSNAFRFLFITDTHGEKTSFNTIKEYFQIVANVEKFGKLDLIVHGGDVINGMLTNTDDALKDLMSYANDLYLKTPTLILAGNHDDNSYKNKVAGTTISNQDWHNFVLKSLERNVHFDSQNTSSKYYYTDLPDKKIRVVCLDAVDVPTFVKEDGNYKWTGSDGWGFREKQLDWLGREALKMTGKEDWQVVVLSHMSTVPNVNGQPYNGDMIEGVLNAFKTGQTYSKTSVGLSEWDSTVSCDFTSQGAREVIGYFYGHVHRDEHFINTGTGINYISTTKCQKDTNGAFDIVTINRDERNVFLDRFGTGEDRTFTY